MSVYNIDGKDMVNHWSGKTASFIGDSITTTIKTTKGYWQYLKDILNLSNVYAYGVDGSYISNVRDPMYSRIENVDASSDIVFLFGGTNDFQGNVPLGDWYVTSNGTRTYDTTLSTFRGALNYTVLSLLEKFPTKQVVLLTPLHRGSFGQQKTDMQSNQENLFLEDYVNCIKQAGDIFSVNVIDLYGYSGLYPYNQNNAEEYFNYDISDMLHPNASGHERIAKVIASKLIGLSTI